MVRIIGIPSTLGCNTPGADLSPKALRNANLLKAFSLSNINYIDLGDIVTNNTKSNNSNIKAKNLDKIIDIVKKTVGLINNGCAINDQILSIGGDHSIAIGSIFATTERIDSPYVLWIDAHADSNSPETSPSGNIHGMPVATILGDSLFHSFLQKQVDKSRLILLGVKDVDDKEWQYIRENKIMVYTIDDIVSRGIGNIWIEIDEKLGNEPLHVSLDIDGLDYSIAPGTGIINNGGISYREIKFLARQIAMKRLVALDVAEINPLNDINNKTVELAVELILDFFGGKWTEYEKYLATQAS